MKNKLAINSILVKHATVFGGTEVYYTQGEFTKSLEKKPSANLERIWVKMNINNQQVMYKIKHTDLYLYEVYIHDDLYFSFKCFRLRSLFETFLTELKKKLNEE
jgi:hypothetical protein